MQPPKTDTATTRFGSSRGFVVLEVQRVSDGATIRVGFATADAMARFFRQAEEQAKKAWPGQFEMIDVRDGKAC